MDTTRSSATSAFAWLIAVGVSLTVSLELVVLVFRSARDRA